MIKEVRGGRATESFKAATTQNTPGEELCFSIIYTAGSKFKNVDLAAYTEKDRDAWISSINYLIKQNGRTAKSSL